MDLTVLTRRDDFDALCVEWTDLEAHAGKGCRLFQSHAWLSRWAGRHLAGLESKGHRLAIFTGRLNGRLVLVWPTMLEPHGPVTKLVWMGGACTGYGDVLIEAGPEAQALLQASFKFIKANSGADLIQLSRVREDAAVASLLSAEVAQKTSQTGEARTLVAQSLASCAEIPALASRRARSMQQRKRRRLMSRSSVEVVRVSGGPDALALVASAARQKLLASGLHAASTAEDLASQVAGLYGDATLSYKNASGLEVFALMADSEPAAIMAGVRHGNTFVSLMTTVAAQFRKYSAASLLLEEVVETVSLRERCTIVFPGAANPFTTRWSMAGVAVEEWQKPISSMGHVYMKLQGGIVHKAAKTALKTLGD